MAAVNPPSYIQASTHPSDVFRRALRALRGQAGVVATGDLAVAQNGTPNMSVNVAAGLAVIDGTENATTQGTYIALNDATVNLAIAASDPTNPRNDLVVAKVQDAQYSGATNAWSLAVVTGTPAGSPVDPATPANSITLARVRVDALVATIVNAKITDLRPFAGGVRFPGGNGFTVWDSTGLLKNLLLADSGTLTMRHPGLILPPTQNGTPVATSAGTVPVLIDTQTPGAVGSFDFVNPLPTLYRSLEIEWDNVRGDTVAATTTMSLRFNNDSAANYDEQHIAGSGATASSAEALAQNIGQFADIPAASATANYTGSGSCRIPGYSAATGLKIWIANESHWTGNATGNGTTLQRSGKWRTVNTAVTRITVLLGAGNFANGTFRLWGRP